MLLTVTSTQTSLRDSVAVAPI